MMRGACLASNLRRLGAWSGVHGACSSTVLSLRLGFPVPSGLRHQGSSATSAGTPGLRRIEDDGALASLLNGPQAVLLHCGAAWAADSARSRAITKRLEEFAPLLGPGVVCAGANVEDVPLLLERWHVGSVPTMLLVCNGKTEGRATGADAGDLEQLLSTAKAFSVASASASDAMIDEELSVTSSALLKSADLARNQGAPPDVLEGIYNRVLQGVDKTCYFRAKLGLLSCAVWRLEDEIKKTGRGVVEISIATMLARHFSSIVDDKIHSLEIDGDAVGAVEIEKLLAHSELLLMAQEELPQGGDTEAVGASSVLRYYVSPENGGQLSEALAAALQWYHLQASDDSSMKEALKSPPWRAKSTGPYESRRMLQLLFAAIGHRSELVADARADLEFLLDRKKWTPFAPRYTSCRKGGYPFRGRGTGKRSGFSTGYWIAWGPGTLYRNTKKMHGPHTDFETPPF